jgi:hypothetical protein
MSVQLGGENFDATSREFPSTVGDAVSRYWKNWLSRWDAVCVRVDQTQLNDGRIVFSQLVSVADAEARIVNYTRFFVAKHLI